MNENQDTWIKSPDTNNMLKKHFLFVVGFSLPFAYLLSFLFEGRVLYSFLDNFDIYFPHYIFATIGAHFLGLFLFGWFIKPETPIQRIMFSSISLCFLTSIPFLFSPSILWGIGLILSGFSGGILMSTLGYFLKRYIKKAERVRIIAGILICSNLLMTIIYSVDLYISSTLALVLAMGCLLAGTVFLGLLIGESKFIVESGKHNINTNSMRQAQQVLFLFVFVITINSGFMYQVVNPQFGHLSGIMTWYWAVPYIVAIWIMGRLAPNIKGAPYIYIALIMLMSALVGFIFLEHNLIGYLIINALMLGSFGVFDLFWWSILGEMLEYSKNPARVFGVGLSANVLGILVGGIFGYFGNQYEFSTTEITVIALVVLCITILLLPLLNQKIKALLKSHTYLAVYGEMAELEQREMVQSVMEMLTNREKEVLEQILYGKTNSAIGEKLSISENTVKTHVGNIYSKYDVRSRAELINTVLRNTVNIKT